MSIGRNLHKIARCVHDHVCPRCGSLELVKHVRAFPEPVRHECRECGWKITHIELQAAMKAGVPEALRDALVDFKAYGRIP